MRVLTKHPRTGPLSHSIIAYLGSIVRGQMPSVAGTPVINQQARQNDPSHPGASSTNPKGKKKNGQFEVLAGTVFLVWVWRLRRDEMALTGNRREGERGESFWFPSLALRADDNPPTTYFLVAARISRALSLASFSKDIRYLWL
jgi:hypothetical protein